MRVAVTGASGNVGTSVLRSLIEDPNVEGVVGISRRRPQLSLPKVQWHSADIRDADLAELFRGSDAVIHLAWLIQPSRDERELASVNVEGSARVFEAVAKAGVPKLVYASSVGAYSPGPKDRAVDENHPTDGITTSFYSRHKARVERLLDSFEEEHPEIEAVRLRPALIFKGEAGTEIRRLFIGPLLPRRLVSRRLIPALPAVRRLNFQAVHSQDVAEAYRLALRPEISGAFNVAAEPVLTPRRLAQLMRAVPVPVPAPLLRAAADLTWRARLQPTPPGWVDMALSVPIMDTRRAREVLGWQPRYDAEQALLELLEGIQRGEDYPTPPLDADRSGPGRIREFLTGVGGRNL
jgi:UDP-glucose 4-epimerase